MQEDKNLKELLVKYTVKETSADFIMNVMLRIESANAARPYQTSLLKHKLLQILMVAFVLVCIVLLAQSILCHLQKLVYALL